MVVPIFGGNESGDDNWGRERFVVARPETPDSELVGLNVIHTRADHATLSAIVYSLVDRLRLRGAEVLRRELAEEPEKFVRNSPESEKSSGGTELV